MRETLFCRWITGEWSDCSISCGTGIQTRDVHCVETHENKASANGSDAVENRKVADKYCWQIQRPVVVWSWRETTAFLAGNRTRMCLSGVPEMGIRRLESMFGDLRKGSANACCKFLCLLQTLCCTNVGCLTKPAHNQVECRQDGRRADHHLCKAHLKPEDRQVCYTGTACEGQRGTLRPTYVLSLCAVKY